MVAWHRRQNGPRPIGTSAIRGVSAEVTRRTLLLLGVPMTLCGCFAYQPSRNAAVPALRGVKLQSQVTFPVVMLDARGVATQCQVTELRGALVDRRRDTVRLATTSARNRWDTLSPACTTSAAAVVDLAQQPGVEVLVRRFSWAGTAVAAVGAAAAAFIWSIAAALSDI